MDGIFFALGWAASALLLVAVVVAGWEHWRRRGAPPVITETAPRGAVSLDVDIDAMPPAGDDQHRRQEVLGAALVRMSEKQEDPRAAHARGWIETRPMVAHGPAPEVERH